MNRISSQSAFSVKIVFLGDIYLGDNPGMYRLNDSVRRRLEEADLVVANQEGAITTATEVYGDKGHMKSSPATAEVLRDWDVDIVTLANNHVFDYGWDGFRQTCEHLDDVGIQYLGAGKDLKEATRPLVIEVNNQRILFLAYSWEFVETTCAGENTFGCAPLEEELAMRQVRELKAKTDSVIVMPHWGYCDYVLPTPFEKSLAGKMLSAGATAVVGTHSHAVQGMEEVNGKFIAYNLGDFAFGQCRIDRKHFRIKDLPKESRKGVVLTLDISLGRISSHDVAFTTMSDDGEIHPNDVRSRRSEFDKRCRSVRNNVYSARWRSYVRFRFAKRLLFWMNFLNWWKIRKGTLTGLWLMIKHSLGGKK